MRIECAHVCESLCEYTFTHGELVVDFVDVFVDPAMMQQPMQKVVPGVFDHSAAETLNQNVRPEEGDQKRKSPWSRVVIVQRSPRPPHGQQNRWNCSQSTSCLTEGWTDAFQTGQSV